MGISLVMATVDRCDEIRRVVHSLVAQTDGAFELVIVDQNDDSRLEAIVREGRDLGLDVVHERYPVRNLSAARNHGISCARFDVVGFPDDDCWYEPSVIGLVRRFLVEEPNFSGIVARWYEENPVCGERSAVSLDRLRRFRERDTSSITLFLQRSVLEDIGGFDERFGVSRYFGASEETDLLMRYLSIGQRVCYLPEVVVHHAYPSKMLGSVSQVCRRMRSRERGVGAIYAKHKLPHLVIARGFLAPILRSCIPPTGVRSMLAGCSVTVGRIEGYVKWRAMYS
jgi:glycosyltransferase involved in cell wall biosynthesis